MREGGGGFQPALSFWGEPMQFTTEYRERASLSGSKLHYIICKVEFSERRASHYLRGTRHVGHGRDCCTAGRTATGSTSSGLASGSA